MDIEKKYKINPGTLDRINKFKELAGVEAFEQILQGVAEVDIPFEENKFEKFMKIFLDEQPAEGYNKIPYMEACEIASFFCHPFAGKYLKQAKSTLNGISSLLQSLKPEDLKMLMESINFRKTNGTSIGASNSPKETSSKESGSIGLQHQEDLPN